MKLNELLLGSAICIMIAGFALASNALLDRYLPLHFEQQAEAAANDATACVDAQGSWVNWPWANVPALSPRCDDASPAGKMPPQSKTE
jgi:hypothetical protein